MDWPMYRRVERQAVRMHEMMARLGVNPVALARLRQGEAYAEARARCLFCKSADECLRWLESDASPRSAPAFCPNLPLFELCCAERGATVAQGARLSRAEFGAAQKKFRAS